jgi:hypothetical protein
MVEDVRYLHILIFKCEADWAYGMMLKQRATQKSSKINPQRAKVHCIKRIKAAVKQSSQLFVGALDSLS